jgi:hypothetical protein
MVKWVVNRLQGFLSAEFDDVPELNVKPSV